MSTSCKMIITYIVFYLILTANCAENAAGKTECFETSCSKDGPVIRFPFWLKDRQPSYCGYPGFGLSCSDNKQTFIELPVSVKMYVKDIDYISQMISVSDPETCQPRNLKSLNLSTSSFNFYRKSIFSYSFFNCTSRNMDLNGLGYEIPCLANPGYQVYVIYSSSYIGSMPISSCAKIFEILSFPFNFDFPGNNLLLNWTTPQCSLCEAENKKCGIKSNSTLREMVCYGNLRTSKGAMKAPLITGLVLVSLLLVAAILVLCYKYRKDKAEKENQVKIEKFLEDYKALKPTRYTYADIKRITNDFKEKLGEGGYGTVFKGKLSHEIYVAVKILNNSKGNGEEFINEVRTMGLIHHVNVVRLVGYCADGFRRALVYEFLPNESLEKFIFSTKRNNQILCWDKLLNIAISVAKGIEYLHQGCEQRILHFDIKPSNVLLDDNFNPKISDFGLAKLCSKDQSAISMATARGTMGYIAPEVFSRNFGNVSYKSDVYSFGMLLLEMVGGRKNMDVTVENSGLLYYPEWIYNHLEQGEELIICLGEKEEEGNADIAKRLAIVGVWCIQWHPVNRPSMKTVLQMLEGDDNLKVPPNPFSSTRSYRNQHVKPLDLELATISEI
ncbi:rust resistance kinase Lr10-like [Mercurialis annua]|uniref:rust resistance kinase Lr10-like n=1 Tax=Mercurialis annua TaxID=3986 RepID=UPI00216091D7|nr:rust resistance kinase Lr10-like [Mercurialis annua]